MNVRITELTDSLEAEGAGAEQISVGCLSREENHKGRYRTRRIRIFVERLYAGV